MHVEKWPAVMLAAKRLPGVAPEVDLKECTLHLPLQKSEVRQNPLCLWNPEEMSPEVQNRDTSGPIKDMCPPKTFKEKCKRYCSKKLLLFALMFDEDIGRFGEKTSN